MLLGGGDPTSTPLVVYSPPSLDRWISFRCNGAMCLNYTSGSYRILSLCVAAIAPHRSMHARSIVRGLRRYPGATHRQPPIQFDSVLHPRRSPPRAQIRSSRHVHPTPGYERKCIPVGAAVERQSTLRPMLSTPRRRHSTGQIKSSTRGRTVHSCSTSCTQSVGSEGAYMNNLIRNIIVHRNP